MFSLSQVMEKNKLISMILVKLVCGSDVDVETHKFGIEKVVGVFQ